jgi:hypothetical protein
VVVEEERCLEDVGPLNTVLLLTFRLRHAYLSILDTPSTVTRSNLKYGTFAPIKRRT